MPKIAKIAGKLPLFKSVKNRQFSRKNRRRFFEIFCRQVALKNRRFGDKSPLLAILNMIYALFHHALHVKEITQPIVVL